jgi:hypothetical protein
MRIFFTILFGLYTIYGFSQANATSAKTEANGSYSFRSLTVTVYNAETKAEVITRQFSDTASLKGLDELPVPYTPIFLSAQIQNSRLINGVLWNADTLVPDNNNVVTFASSGETDNNVVDIAPYIPPVYSLEIEGNTAVYSFTQRYGNSGYNFQLQAKFEMVLVKD